MPALRKLRAPIERLQLAGLDAHGERRAVLALGRIAAHGCVVGIHRREFLAELEALAFLPARCIAHALEGTAAQRAAKFPRRRATEKDRRGAFAQGGYADLGARLTFEEAPRERRQHDVLPRKLPRAVGRLARM